MHIIFNNVPGLDYHMDLILIFKASRSLGLDSLHVLLHLYFHWVHRASRKTRVPYSSTSCQKWIFGQKWIPSLPSGLTFHRMNMEAQSLLCIPPGICQFCKKKGRTQKCATRWNASTQDLEVWKCVRSQHFQAKSFGIQIYLAFGIAFIPPINNTMGKAWYRTLTCLRLLNIRTLFFFRPPVVLSQQIWNHLRRIFSLMRWYERCWS